MKVKTDVSLDFSFSEFYKVQCRTFLSLLGHSVVRIGLRMTQKIILHGEPAFLKQSPLGWHRVVPPGLRTQVSKMCQSFKALMQYILNFYVHFDQHSFFF